MPGGACQVAAAVHRHHAAPVRAAPDPAHGVEGGRGQSEHGGEVLAERLRGRSAVACARGGAQPVASIPKQRVQLADRADPGDGHEQVPPDEAHGVLDRPPLVARVRIAVATAHAVVGAEQREQLRLRHLAAHAAARLGGVVEDELARGAPDPSEDLGQARAHALGALGHAGDGVARVGVRKAYDEQLEAQPLAGDLRLEVAVVRLRGAGRPLKLKVAITRARRTLEPPSAHMALHGRIGAPIAPLLDEAVVDPFGGVALLARGAEVRLEQVVDPVDMRVYGGARSVRRHRRLRRHVAHVGVVGDGVAAKVEPSR